MNLYEVKYRGSDQVINNLKKTSAALTKNIGKVIAKSTLFGVTKISLDTPVDTGRARASVIGDFNIPVMGNPLAVAEGRAASLTEVSSAQGKIGSNLSYILPLEMGHRTRGSKKLTPKQLRYLFAKGILQSRGGKVGPSIHSVINKRAGIGFRVKGVGMFRKNRPIIDKYFHDQMDNAIEAANEGRLLV